MNINDSVQLTPELIHLNDDIFNFADKLNFGEIHIKNDKETGLKAIIAIHDCTLGPALGGCRFKEYPSTQAAIEDVMRLAHGMTYKAALSRIPHGGGKSVIIKSKKIKDRKALFRAFGRFMNELNGHYITSMDVGTSTEDMRYIGQDTKYIALATRDYMTETDGDPSPFTAQGVFSAIQAAVEFKLNHNSLKGIHVAIQGVGKVGYALAQMLHNAGTRLTITDVNEEVCQLCASKFDATIVAANEIYMTDCDVFTPCALGAVINDKTIPLLRCSIVAGSANNQLARSIHAEALLQRDILYAPDYVTNAGGLIQVACSYGGHSQEEADKKIQNIAPTLLEIFKRSKDKNVNTLKISNEVAEERLKTAKESKQS